MFPVSKMQFSKDKCKVLHFGTSNEQSSNETGTDWFNTVPQTTFQAYERPSAYIWRAKKHTKSPKPLTLVEIHTIFVYLKKKEKKKPTPHISSLLTAAKVSVGILYLGLHLQLQKRHESVGENPQECKIIRGLEICLKSKLERSEIV